MMDFFEKHNIDFDDVKIALGVIAYVAIGIGTSVVVYKSFGRYVAKEAAKEVVKAFM